MGPSNIFLAERNRNFKKWKIQERRFSLKEENLQLLSTSPVLLFYDIVFGYYFMILFYDIV